MARATLFVALAVLLAGCGGVVTSDRPETVTPAPVPTDSFQYPPGVTSDGVVAAELTSAHVRSLATTNYTLTTRQHVRTLDGRTLFQTAQTRRVARDAGTYSGEFHVEMNVTSDSQASNVEFFSNRTVIVTRYTTDNPYREPEIRQWPARSGPSITDLTDTAHLEGYLASADVTPIRRTADGGALLAGSGIRDGGRLILPLIVTEPRNLTLQMRVRHDGVVEAARVSYDATYNGERVRVERATRVRNVGTTAIERPEWAGNGTTRQDYTGYG